MIPRPPTFTLFPYTTLFRSVSVIDSMHYVVAIQNFGFHPDSIAVPAGIGTKTEVLEDRKSTRLNSSHTVNSYAVFCLKKKNADYMHKPHASLLTGEGRAVDI